MTGERERRAGGVSPLNRARRRGAPYASDAFVDRTSWIEDCRSCYGANVARVSHPERGPSAAAWPAAPVPHRGAHAAPLPSAGGPGGRARVILACGRLLTRIIPRRAPSRGDEFGAPLENRRQRVSKWAGPKGHCPQQPERRARPRVDILAGAAGWYPALPRRVQSSDSSRAARNVSVFSHR